MKKILLAAAVSFAAISATAPAHAQTATIGGATAGALAGVIIAGPIGLVVGGVAGGLVGNNMERGPRRSTCYIDDRGREVCRPR